MSNLLDAANVSVDNFIIGELPVKPGDVSIMTLGQAYKVIGKPLDNMVTVQDPINGYDISTYYMYAINDAAFTDDSVSNSTLTNLQMVGLDWYKKLNKPTRRDDHWNNAGEGTHSLFGGPLKLINKYNHDLYVFSWYYSKSGYCSSDYISYWGFDVSGSVYVAIVRAK